MYCPTIKTKNKKVKNRLERLVHILKSNNSYFDKNLIINYNNNELSISSRKIDTILNKYIDIPIDIIPSIDDFCFSLKDKQIVCEAKKDTNIIQSEIMLIMIDIYNISHKIAFQEKSNIFYALRNYRDFLNLLLCSTNNKRIEEYLNLLDESRYDTLVLQSFLHSRVFRYGTKNNHQIKQFILPVLDYLNHKVTTSGFKKDEQKDSIYIETIPDSKSNQIYVSYNYYDSLETLIYYGFSDIDSPVLFSIPMQIPFNDNITIHIENTNFRKLSNEDVSKALLPIKEILPTITKKGDKLIVSKLVIPNSYLPLALRHIIHLILHELNVENNETRLPMVSRLEKYIINNNILFYSNLEKQLQPIIKDKNISTYIKRQLKLLIKTNLNHLKNYASWFS